MFRRIPGSSIRRFWLRWTALTGIAVAAISLSAACSGGAAPQPTAAPAKPAAASTSAPAAAATQAPAKAAAPASGGAVAKLASVLPEDHPQHKSYLYFADKVKEYTGGKLTIQIFPNSQLGNEREYVEGLQIGTLEMAKTSTAVLGPFVPQFQIFDLPYMSASKDVMFKIADGEVGQALLKALADKMNIKGIGFFDSGTRNIYNKSKPINTPADLKGMKIRVMENPLMIQTFNTLGAAATPMASGEQYSALQQGVIDAAENSPIFILSGKFYEVTKYLSMTEHFITPDLPMISLKWYNAQPKEIQEAVDKAGKEMVVKEREFWKDYETSVMTQLKDKGMQINQVTDKAPWVKAVEPIIKDAESKVGKDLIDKAKAVK